MQYFLFIPLAISLALYLFPVILLQRKEYAHAQDYFVSSASPVVFQNSSIAYALQMATFGPFFAWGASSDFEPAILNSVFFCLGLFLVYGLRRPIFDFLQNALGTDSSITVHEFIARQHGNDARVRVIASLLTIFALLGLVLGETFGIAAVLRPVLQDNIDATYMFVFGMLLLMFFYTILAGNAGVMRSDQAQLGMAYLGLFSASAVLLFQISTAKSVSPAAAFAALICGCSCIGMFYYRKFKFLDYAPLPRSEATIPTREPFAGTDFVRLFRLFEIVLNWSVVLVVGAVIATAALVLYSAGWRTTAGGFLNALDRHTTFSSWGLLALVLLPLFYQIVDITNWQRVAAVEKGGSFDPQNPVFKQVFSVYAIESPLIWFFMCMFGILAVNGYAFSTGPDQDPFGNFAKTLISRSDRASGFLVVALLIAVFAIALSTMSAIFSSTLCAIRYDILPAWKPELAAGDGPTSDSEINKERADRESQARRWTVSLGMAFYLFVVAGFYLFDKYLQVKFGGSTYLALLFAFYCAQLAFVPLILGPLVRRRGRPFGAVRAQWALAILIFGALAGMLSIGIYIFSGNDRWLWTAVPACLLVGFALFGLGRWLGPVTSAGSS